MIESEDGDVGPRRHLVYSGLTIVTSIPLLILLLSNGSNVIESIISDEEIPNSFILFIFFSELIKLVIVLWFYSPKKGDMRSEAKSKSSLPYVRRESAAYSKKHDHVFADKSKLVIELFRCMSYFILFVLITHVMLVLLGASFFEYKLLTFQLSIILVSWLYFPLCLIFTPSSILNEITSISMWDTRSLSLNVSKCKFLFVIICTWGSAIVVPLDWDRPWQKWPIPQLYSATFSTILIHILTFFYLSSSYFNHLVNVNKKKKIYKT